MALKAELDPLTHSIRSLFASSVGKSSAGGIFVDRPASLQRLDVSTLPLFARPEGDLSGGMWARASLALLEDPDADFSAILKS